jgi:hypothetical protein
MEPGLYLAWKGKGWHDTRIYLTHMGASGAWEPQRCCGIRIQTQCGPAVAFDPQNGIVLCWKGPRFEDSIWSINFRNWEEVTRDDLAIPFQVPGGSQVAPTIAIAPDGNRMGVPFAAGKGIDSQSIWWTTGGSQPAHIDGIGTNTGPFMTYYKPPWSEGYVPFMCWRGERTDQGIYWNSFDGLRWSPQQGTNFGTSGVPTLTTWHGLRMAWKGILGDESIWWSVFDGYTSWSGQRTLGDDRIDFGSSTGPALASFGDYLYMVWKGSGPDVQIWWSYTADGITWAPQQVVPGVETDSKPALVAIA